MPDQPSDLRLSARELILTLMDSSARASLSARYFVAAGEVFGMDPGSIRVALARLVGDGSLTAAQRGRYRLGSRGGALHTLVRNWARSEESLLPWRGGWLTVLLGHLPRGNKTRLRSNERALGLFGFAEARPGCWLRPANLKSSLDEVHSALLQLGLDEAAIAANVSEFVPSQAIDPATLWPISSLEADYRAQITALATSTDRLAGLAETDAARETLLVGRQVTRQILLDPLLPDDLIDADLRRQMVAAMRDYDRIGKTYWRDFFERHETASDQKPAA